MGVTGKLAGANWRVFCRIARRIRETCCSPYRLGPGVETIEETRTRRVPILVQSTRRAKFVVEINDEAARLIPEIVSRIRFFDAELYGGLTRG